MTVLRLVCISDTHDQGHLMEVPDGDILVHAGDHTGAGSVKQLERAFDWLNQQPHKYKVTIAGNHDFLLESDSERKYRLLDKFGNIIYLENSGVVLEGITFWGSPVQPWWYDYAFQKQRGDELKEHWKQIPDKVDVLITHGPPAGIGDWGKDPGVHFGCQDLLNRIYEVRPQYHIFGHAHAGYGIYAQDGMTFVNAASCTEGYRPTNPPIIIDYEKDIC